MYVYIVSEHDWQHTLYTVGFYSPDGTWNPESDHESKDKAAERVAWLNGSPELENPYILHGKELERTEKSIQTILELLKSDKEQMHFVKLFKDLNLWQKCWDKYLPTKNIYQKDLPNDDWF